jgi:glycosyltransferase involved in cell wall biosynthesis
MAIFIPEVIRRSRATPLVVFFSRLVLLFMHVTAFGTYDPVSHPRMAVLVEGLRAHGAQVAECSRPLVPPGGDRLGVVRRMGRSPLFALRLLWRWLGLAHRAGRQPRPDVVLVGYPGQLDVHLARVLFRHSTIVLDQLAGLRWTAAELGVASRVKLALLGWFDRWALRAADLVLVDTAEQRALLPARYRDQAEVVALGAPRAWFSGVPQVMTDPSSPLRVIFFGGYDPPHGASVVAAALRQAAAVPLEITMVGTGAGRAQAEALLGPDTRVRFLDRVAPEELPTVVATHDVCLGLFGTGPWASRVVPETVFQGAAAGCGVVTADTGPQRRLFGQAAVYAPPGDPGALADTLRWLAVDHQAALWLRRASRARARHGFRPAEVVTPLLDRLPATEGSPSPETPR